MGYLKTQDLTSVNLRKIPAIYLLYARAKRHRNSFFPYCISQWNSLDSRSTNLPSNATFKRAVLDFMCPVSTPMLKKQAIGFCLSYFVEVWGIEKRLFTFFLRLSEVLQDLETL